MKSIGLHRKRLCFYAAVLCFFAFGAAILLLVAINPSDAISNAVSSSGIGYQCKPSDTYQISCNRTLDSVAEFNRLMDRKIKGNYAKTDPKEFDKNTLSGVPAIEGGLYTDQQDLDVPRDDEKYVTFAQYLDCLSARLHVDYHDYSEEELTAEQIETSFPYMVSLATVELQHIRAIMCSINVPIRHMMYVVNSDVTAVHNFFHDVEKTFQFTQRLRIVWPGYNIGFAGSVNLAMRDVLRYPFDTVPFFFIMNNDIRFPRETLPPSLRQFRSITRQDKAVLEGFRKEVAAEPSKYTPPDRRHPLLRSSDNSTLLVTSTALPDRIRYMPYEGRKKIFEKHFGSLFFPGEGQAAAFGISRLAIETVGFFDENFYPAYFEDNDWRLRHRGLGFSEFTMTGVPSKKHYKNVIHRLASQYDARPNTATEVEIFAKGAFHVIHSVHTRHTMNLKFGTLTFDTFAPNPNCTTLPLDAWVMDVPRRKTLIEALDISHKFYKSGGPSQVPDDGILLFGWLPKAHRERLLHGFVDSPTGVTALRAFHNCKLVRHTDL